MANQQMVLVGGNNVTLSQSLDVLSLSATVTVSGGNSYSAGISNIGNTAGASGLVSNQLVLVGGSNVTLSGNTNAGSETITISMIAITTNSFSAGVSNIGNTTGVSGLVSNQLVLVGGDNVTLSGSTNAGSETITISVAGGVIPTLSLWQNMIGITGTIVPHFNFVNVIDLDPKNDLFPGNMTVSTVYFAVSVTGVGTAFMTDANSGTLKLGIYTRNASSLSILNSVSTTWGMTANSNNTRAISGLRWITINSSLWSASPTFSKTQYYLGYVLHTSGGAFFVANWNLPAYTYLRSSLAVTRSGTFGASITSGNTSMGGVPFIGESVSSIAFVAALPASIQLSELNKGNTQYAIVPHMVFNNISSDF